MKQPITKPKTPSSVPVPTTEDSSLQALLEGLNFSPEGIITAAAEQPQLFLKAAEYRVACYRTATQLKMEAERLEADLALRLREEFRKSGEKLTEGYLEQLLLQNDRLAEKKRQQHLADEGEEFSRLLLEGYRMRRDCMKIVGDLTGAEHALQKAQEISAEKIAVVRDRVRAKYPGKEKAEDKSPGEGRW